MNTHFFSEAIIFSNLSQRSMNDKVLRFVMRNDVQHVLSISQKYCINWLNQWRHNTTLRLLFRSLSIRHSYFFFFSTQNMYWQQSIVVGPQHTCAHVHLEVFAPQCCANCYPSSVQGFLLGWWLAKFTRGRSKLINNNRLIKIKKINK